MSAGRVVVIGAGMVGAACAAELSAEADVTVLEAGIPGGGATAACMGHVVVMDDSEAQLALCAWSQRQWDSWAPEMPAAVERDLCGSLWLAEDEEELAAARAKHEFYSARGVVTELLDGAAVQEAEPELRPGLAGALRVPGDSVVYPPAAVVWLLEQAAARAARSGRRFELRRGTAARRARHGTPVATVELMDGSKLEADRVVVAAGLGAVNLVHGAPDSLRIWPRKGHLVITDRRPGFCSHQLVELGYLKSAHGNAKTSVAFNLQPRATGQMLVGSSRQVDDRDPSVETAIVARMLRRAGHFLPRLNELRAVRVWTGFRPATDDHLPYIGPLEHAPSIMLAAGHEGLGITTAPGTARLVADHLLGRESPFDPRPYLPERPVHHDPT